MDLKQALFRRNNQGQPYIWYGGVIRDNMLLIEHGILGKTISAETINTGNRNANAELLSKITSKRKEGYISLNEVTDQVELPVEEDHVLAYLNTYLPHDRQSSTGAMLPMLAKLYDNSNNKLFKDSKHWIAQPKINGLRCLIGAKLNQGDMFRPIKFTFQSREGTYWDSLEYLEDYLAITLPHKVIDLMLKEGYLLDGELYIPGETVNDINSYVKNIKMDANKLIQFWCYDLAIPNMSQEKRIDILNEYLSQYLYIVAGIFNNNIDKNSQHKLHSNRLTYIGNQFCNSGKDAIYLRDKYIKWGFEGVILRDPDKEYQFGKRNLSMVKYKESTDGKFMIINIIPEGSKRPDIPLLVLMNDINAETFNVHVGGSLEYQRYVLKNKHLFLGRKALVEYGERSGINQVPFHVKQVTILEKGD